MLGSVASGGALLEPQWAGGAHLVCPGRQSGDDRVTSQTRIGFPATQKIIRLAETSQPTYAFCFGVALSVSPRRNRAASIRWPYIPEATMELVVRLNVLAALLSFGFIAAIVFGVV